MLSKIFGASWRTTLVAIFFALAAVGSAGGALLDGDPSTVPNWELVLAALAAAFGFGSARDNKTSSESAGAK